jgi:protein farnesyltransferase subunit beta
VTARAGEGVPDVDEWAASLFSDGEQIFDEEDRVKPVHPVFVIPQDKADAVRQYFMAKAGF